MSLVFSLCIYCNIASIIAYGACDITFDIKPTKPQEFVFSVKFVTG